MLGFQCSSTRVQNGSNLISWFLHNTSPGSTKTWVWESLYSMKKEWDMLQEHWRRPVPGQHSLVIPSLRRLGSLRFAFWYLVPWRNGTKLLGKRPESISFFWGSQGFPWVREFCNYGWEIGLKLEFWFWSKLPCLGNEQGNVPEKIMNLTSAPFDSVSCRRCRRRGVGGDFTSCGFWEDVPEYSAET